MEEAERTIKVNGANVRRQRMYLALSQAELGGKVGMSESGIRAIENGRSKGVFPSTFRAIAEAFGLNVQEAKAKFGIDPQDWVQHTSGTAEIKASSSGSATKLREVVENVEPYSEKKLVAQIPFFDLPLAAGAWVSVTDNEEGGYFLTRAQQEQGLFRVRIRGDSMRPRYEDGCIVEFRLLRNPEGAPDCGRVQVGRRYYVQLDDGTGTFKQLESCDERGLVLRALNKKYKKPLVASFDRIQRLAIAEGTFNPET